MVDSVIQIGRSFAALGSTRLGSLKVTEIPPPREPVCRVASPDHSPSRAAGGLAGAGALQGGGEESKGQDTSRSAEHEQV